MNKKTLVISVIIVVILVLFVSVFSINSYIKKGVDNADLSGKKTLVVYYSYSSHTEEVANMIKNLLKCDIKRINSQEYENKSVVELTSLVTEQIQENYIPKTNIIDMSDYDVIFLGSPVWKGNLSLPVKSFLINNNFNNKVIVPFYTFGGYVEKSKLDNQIKEFSRNDNVSDSFLTVYHKCAFIKFRLIKWMNGIKI